MDPSDTADRVSAWTADRTAMTRALALTWFGGATILLLSCALPAGAGEHLTLAIGVTVAGYVSAILMLRHGSLPPWAFETFITLGTVLVSLTVVASGDSTSPYAFFYVWITVQAFYFLPASHAAAQVAVVAIGYVSAMLMLPGAEGRAVSFLMAMGAVVATGAFAGALRRRVDRLTADLLDLARRDPLTGLLNRRGIEEELAGRFELARRTRQEMSLLAIDLDHFKAINDRWGHAAGDRVLVQAAAALRECCRRTDVPARMGGDEFLVLLPDTGIRGAEAAAQRFRAALRCAGDAPTASIGIAAYPQHGDDAGATLRAADAALYRAKPLGRARTETPGDPVLAG